MKNLIIAVVVVCAATFANAASFSWMTYNEADTDLKTEGLKLYICTIGSTGFKNEGEVVAAVIGTEGNMSVLAEDTTYGGTFAAGTVRGIDDGLSGQTQEFTYVIISSDGKGYWAFNDSAEIYTTASSHLDAETDISAMLSTAYTPFSAGPTPVPEPTSGLLLVLGMAGLALRRRHT